MFFQGKELEQTSMSMTRMEPYRIFLELFFIMGVDRIAWVTVSFIAAHILLFSSQLSGLLTQEQFAGCLSDC